MQVRNETGHLQKKKCTWLCIQYTVYLMHIASPRESWELDWEDGLRALAALDITASPTVIWDKEIAKLQSCAHFLASEPCPMHWGFFVNIPMIELHHWGVPSHHMLSNETCNGLAFNILLYAHTLQKKLWRSQKVLSAAANHESCFWGSTATNPVFVGLMWSQASNPSS